MLPARLRASTGVGTVAALVCNGIFGKDNDSGVQCSFGRVKTRTARLQDEHKILGSASARRIPATEAGVAAAGAHLLGATLRTTNNR